MGSRLLLATKNKKKGIELQNYLGDLPFEVITLDSFPCLPDVEEDGHTFKENAIKKAVEAARYSGVLTLADDSGLEVDFLNGEPGVYSARFAGEPRDDLKNNEKLLSLLKDVPFIERTARFVCVIAIAFYDQKDNLQVYTTTGTCEGIILDKLQGDGGFGYDPLFYLPQYDQTFAQIPLTEKNRISHRGQALEGAVKILRHLFNI